MIVGSTWNANSTLYCAPSAPSTLVMIRGHTVLSPSGPKTMLDPTDAKFSSWLISDPSVWNTRCPVVVFSTSSAKTICRLRPHATVRRSIARRLVDSA